MRDGPDNPARPGPGVALCALADLADPGSKGFRFREGGKMFAGFVVQVGGQIRGYVDSCPHAGWPLAAWDDRYLTREGELILCGGHAALFRRSTASASPAPAPTRSSPPGRSRSSAARSSPPDQNESSS